MDAYNRAWNHLVRKYGILYYTPVNSLKQRLKYKSKKEALKIIDSAIWPKEFIIAVKDVSSIETATVEDKTIYRLMKSYSFGLAVQVQLDTYLDMHNIPEEFTPLPRPRNYKLTTSNLKDL